MQLARESNDSSLVQILRQVKIQHQPVGFIEMSAMEFGQQRQDVNANVLKLNLQDLRLIHFSVADWISMLIAELHQQNIIERQQAIQLNQELNNVLRSFNL